VGLYLVELEDMVVELEDMVVVELEDMVEELEDMVVVELEDMVVEEVGDMVAYTQCSLLLLGIPVHIPTSTPTGLDMVAGAVLLEFRVGVALSLVPHLQWVELLFHQWGD
jgi:hypothetical protein